MSLEPVSQMLSKLIIKNIVQIIAAFIRILRLQFCICNDSSAVVACTKLWPNQVIIFHVKSTDIFTRFALWTCKLLVKCVPEHMMK